VSTQIVLPSAINARPSTENLGDPTRDIRIGLILAVAFFVVFLGWAAFARLDAAAFAPGVLEVSGQRQTVQHRDGGVVSEIFVREGQRVVRGQLLMRLAAADVRAQERALSAQAIRLLSQRARLEAEESGAASVSPPAEFAALPVEDRDDAAAALRLQQSELVARRATLSAQRGAFQQRSQQSLSQGKGYGTQVVSSVEQLRLIDQQIAALKPLADRGFVSLTRLRELERVRAEMIGQRGQYSASVAQTQSAAQESRINVIEAERTFRERTALDLREVDTRLSDVLPKLAAARDQLARTDVRATATGAVIALTVFTPGGVIGPGQKLMDIVPENTPLRIQARVGLDDADDLSVGQSTLIKFPSLHERDLPNLTGKLTRLSADAITDEKTGQSYFTAEVLVPRDQLKLLKDARGESFELRAGMPVQVLVPLRQRTALSYALEPLVGSFWASFREH
jgi:HlyD family secretion protein